MPRGILKCSSASRYKGKREPRCNGGNPCYCCRVTWLANNADKPVPRWRPLPESLFKADKL